MQCNLSFITQYNYLVAFRFSIYTGSFDIWYLNNNHWILIYLQMPSQCHAAWKWVPLRPIGRPLNCASTSKRRPKALISFCFRTAENLLELLWRTSAVKVCCLCCRCCGVFAQCFNYSVLLLLFIMSYMRRPFFVYYLIK